MRYTRGRMIDEVLVLAAGYAGKAVLALARQRGLVTKAVLRTSSALEVPDGHAQFRLPAFDASIASLVGPRAHVVVTFPPDGETDARITIRAGAITYLSTTGVYGARRGIIDDDTPVAEPTTASIALRLAAEESWRRRGATILRCPAIYGPDRGLHVRVIRGQHKIPGDGSGYVSRIHVEDLAALVLASSAAPGETFVVGDEKPARHAEVVAWICATYGVPMPPSVPLSEVHETLRGDRRVDGSRALRRLGVTLRFPTYESGYAPQR